MCVCVWLDKGASPASNERSIRAILLSCSAAPDGFRSARTKASGKLAWVTAQPCGSSRRVGTQLIRTRREPHGAHMPRWQRPPTSKHTPESPDAERGHAESPAGAQWRTHVRGCAKDCHGPALSSSCHTHSHALAPWAKAMEALLQPGTNRRFPRRAHMQQYATMEAYVWT